ncbi:MAG: hypothetical protein KC910_17125 [Candidatus Eremiobacteraeota bacterium]|nr:hypothetical protein [Candidatus Eremiobacteraeota bacterium]
MCIHSSIRFSAPPGSRANKPAPAEVQLQAPAPEQAPRTDSTSFWGKALLVGAGVAGLVAAAPAAQAAEPTSVSEPVETRVTLSQGNDSLPGFLSGIVPEKDRVPGQDRNDDDGWTAELRGEYVRTQGDDQWVGAGRYSMLTQRGAWEPAPDYHGLRTDLAEIGVQHNTRLHLDGRTDLIYGVGGGLQSLGNLGGHDFQEWFHANGGFGGRVGDSLQANYTTDGFTIRPVVTGGVALHRQLDEAGQFSAKTSLEGTLPLGRGLSSLRGEAGLEYRPFDRLTFEGGVRVEGAYSNHPALDFLEVDGVRPGAFAGAELGVTRNLHAFARVETGGIRDEPVYLVGFTIGGGSKPWLDPLW